MKIKLSLSIGIEGSREDEVDWKEISDIDMSKIGTEERERLIYNYWLEWAWQYIDGCGEVVN
jgi:hypothetical protein